MNGSAYYSPPSRHTRCLGDRFIEGDLPREKPKLEEFPFLVAKAIAAGLIQLPGPGDLLKVEPVEKPVAEWRRISCIKCGEVFVRGHHHIAACPACRLDKRKCAFCQKEYQPTERKQTCCSAVCRENKTSLPKTPTRVLPTHICKACQQPFTGRLSGAGWAKTCSRECANTANRNYYAEKRELRLAAKAAKK
jgi:hypothetical protein